MIILTLIFIGCDKLKNIRIVKYTVIISSAIVLSLSVIFLYCTSLDHQISILYLSGSKLKSLMSQSDKNSGHESWLGEIDRGIFMYNNLKKADLYAPYRLSYGNALMYYDLKNINELIQSNLNNLALRDYGYCVPVLFNQGKKSIRITDIYMENSKITGYEWKFVMSNDPILDITPYGLKSLLKKNNIKRATNIKIIESPLTFIHISYFNKEWFIPLCQYDEEKTGLYYGKAYSKEQFLDGVNMIKLLLQN